VCKSHSPAENNPGHKAYVEAQLLTGFCSQCTSTAPGGRSAVAAAAAAATTFAATSTAPTEAVGRLWGCCEGRRAGPRCVVEEARGVLVHPAQLEGPPVPAASVS